MDYIASSGLEFKRVYNSQSAYEAPSQLSLGQGGWRLGWNRSIRGTPSVPPNYPPSTSLIVYRLGLAPNWVPDTTVATAYLARGDGKTYTFTRNGSNWQASADITGQLTNQFDTTGKVSGWTYITEDKGVEQYNAAGLMTSVTDRAGQVTTLAYSDGTTAAPNGGYVLDAAGIPTTTPLPSGLLIRLTDAYQRSISLGYDDSIRIVKMTDPAGGIYRYGYDSNSNLTSVTYPDNKTKQYVYENATYPSALTGIIDENYARYATYGYDSSGRANSSEHAGGAEKITLVYNPNGTTDITDALSTVRTQTFQTVFGMVKNGGSSQPGGSGCAASSSNQTYDANGNLASSTDFNGNLTTYIFDLARNLETSRTEGLTAAGAKTAATRTTNTDWHPVYPLPATVTEQDTSGATPVTLRTTTLNYYSGTANVHTRTITDALNPSDTRIWTYTYNAQGQPLTVDGPRTDVSDTTIYTYNNGNLENITNALFQLTTLTDYTAHGQPQRITDPNGLVTILGYNSRQQLTSQNTDGRITSYDYYATGQLKKITEPAGNTLTYTYDNAHRLTDITDNLGNNVHYTLDLMGNPTREDVRDITNTLLRTHNRVYDALNRLQREYGVITQFTYEYDAQGNLKSVTDALNQSTRYEYDALSRQTKHIDPVISGAPTGFTRYSYNALDQLTQVTDPNTVATQYGYNALGDLKQLTSLDSGTTQNDYDAAGNLITRTDAKGQSATYTYDELNRLTRAIYPATASSPALQIDYQYDNGSNAKGRLTHVTETENSTVVAITTYGYTSYGEVDNMTRTQGSLSATTRYHYDTAGRMIGLTYPSGRKVDYVPDGIGRIAQVISNKNGITQTVASNITYAGFDTTPTAYTLGNGRVVNRPADLEGKLSSYTLSGNVQTLGYDNAAHIISRSNNANPLVDSSTYGYDALDRLISEVMPSTAQSYQYDANGNRTSRTVGTATETYAYNPATNGNRLNSVTLGGNTRTFSHDPNGSITLDNAIQYGYDARNRKVQAIASGTTTQYKYDAFGQRIQKSDPQTQTLFSYDQNGKLISESDGQGIPKREYIYLGGKPVAVWE